MFCPKCGTECADGAKFCPSCGAPIPSSGAQPSQAAPAASAQPQAAAPKRRHILPIAIGVGAIAVVAVAGFAAYQLMFAPWSIDNKTFPDPSVRAAVMTLDEDGDGKIEREAASEVQTLTISNPSEVSGLGRMFPELTTLYIDGDSEVTKLDVSDLAHLSTLQVASSVKLETVDLSHNAELTTLSLPNATTASGLEAAGLAEHWYLTDIDSALPLGDESYSVEWDFETGRVNSVDVDGTPYVLEYDDAGRMTAYAIRYGGGSSGARVDFTYDDAGRIATASPKGFMDWSDPWNFAYNDAGSLASQLSSLNGGGYTWTYDDEGRPTQEAYYERPTQRWTYDDEGRVTHYERLEDGYQMSVEGNSSTYDFTYDDEGRVTQVAYATGYNDGMDMDNLQPGSDVERATITYTYDDEGRLVQASTDSGATATCSYDTAGNLIGVTTSGIAMGGMAGNTSYDMAYTRRFVSDDVEMASSPLIVAPSYDGSMFRCYFATLDVPQTSGLAPAIDNYSYRISSSV